MPQVEVKEIAQDIKLLDTPQYSSDDFHLILDKEVLDYHQDYHYYIKYHKTEGNRILSLIGLPYEVEYFETINPNEVGFAKVNIDEDNYKKIKFSLMSKDYLTFYDEEKDLVYSRRLSIRLIQGKYDSDLGCLINDDPSSKNVIKFQVFGLDSNDDPSDDIQEIHCKILRAGGDNMPVPNISVSFEDINGNNVVLNKTNRKGIFKNGVLITVNLNSENDIQFMTLRFKAFVPNVNYWWLTLYIKLRKIFE
jgi:hypothetical protein